jgi:hypothetical protein
MWWAIVIPCVLDSRKVERINQASKIMNHKGKSDRLDALGMATIGVDAPNLGEEILGLSDRAHCRGLEGRKVPT